ncbi:MAG TPA: hypothetical protein VF584_19485 [Longimicrobium sp.]|jgi:phosphate-selective porin
MPILDVRRIALAASLSLCAVGAAAAQEGAPAAPSAGAPAAVSAPPAAAQTAAAPAARAPRRDRNKVTEEELAGRTESDTYSFIQKARPQWLRVRGQSSMSISEQVWVYRYGAKIGGVGALRNVALSEVREIQYLDGSAATARFGPDHGSGAILLITR